MLREEWMKRIGCIVLLALVPPPVHAQITDTLREMVVEGQRAPGAAGARLLLPGAHLQVLDSTTLRLYEGRNVAAVLGEQTSVFVKSYGLNALATLNIRGASAAQSAVLWNGVPLTNPALGLTDVSTLPIALIDRVTVAYGGSSALWGSGALGGAVLLESTAPAFADSSRAAGRVGLGYGSFGQRNISLQGSFSGKRWSAAARGFGQWARNDFPYEPVAGGTERRMPNSALAGGGGLAQASWQPARGHTVSSAVWVQRYIRHIPPALFEARSQKVQEDAAARVQLRWERRAVYSTAAVNMAFLRDVLSYADTAIGLHAHTQVNAVFVEPLWRIQIRDGWSLYAAAPVQHAWRPSAAGTVQTKGAGTVGVTHRSCSSSLTASVLLRGEAVDDWGIILPAISASYLARPGFILRGLVQRSFRAPTLAERFAVPGGNIHLRPERGWSAEAGTSLSKNGLRSVAAVEATAFYRTVQDWILWYGGAIWTPHNIAAVRSRGTELTGRAERNLGRVQVVANWAGAYTRATTTVSYAPGDGSIGRQIPYTPRVTANAGVTAGWKSFRLGYAQHYTGQRFPTSDESHPLAAYTTGSLTAVVERKLRNTELRLSGAVYNLWDVRYVTVAGRPMPGRYALITLSADFSSRPNGD